MNKQEKEELVNQLNGRLTNCPSDSWDKGYNEGIKTAVRVARNLPTVDEPQKVKVPAFVADWIELCKEKADLSSCLNGYYEIGDGTIVRPRGFSEEFYDWLSDYDHMHDLARAYLDGYEVEEEPKWIVPVPNLSKDFFYTADGEHISFCQRKNINDVKSKVKFTLKEVERLFPELVDTLEKV
ncbi:MAG: hypothetical protein ACFWTP_05485 [Enterococcus gilvus]|jgi:hypothetical protein|uniref:DUF1642 domain-containing protein n=1 Tax=Enterococcus gilvus TaxID=160453 RepID=UPI0039F5D71C